MNKNPNTNITDLIVYVNEHSHYSVHQSVKFVGIDNFIVCNLLSETVSVAIVVPKTDC